MIVMKMASFYIGIIDSINRNKNAVCCKNCGSLIYNNRMGYNPWLK